MPERSVSTLYGDELLSSERTARRAQDDHRSHGIPTIFGAKMPMSLPDAVGTRAENAQDAVSERGVSHGRTDLSTANARDRDAIAAVAARVS
jgi:hypothetical protein